MSIINLLIRKTMMRIDNFTFDISKMDIDEVVKILKSTPYCQMGKNIDALLRSDNIITSFDDFFKIIIMYKIGNGDRIRIVKKYKKYCDNIESIKKIINCFASSGGKIAFIKICKSHIRKIDDLLQILLVLVWDYDKVNIVKMFDFIGITFPDILKVVDVVNGHKKTWLVNHFRHNIDLDTTIKLVNESGVEEIGEIFSVENFDEFIEVIVGLKNNQHRNQLILECEHFFNEQNLIKYLSLLNDFSKQFEIIDFFHKKITFENPFELLKCINGVTIQDDKNRKQLFVFIVKKMNIRPNISCLDYFMTETEKNMLIEYLIKLGIIKLNLTAPAETYLDEFSFKEDSSSDSEDLEDSSSISEDSEDSSSDD